VRARLEAGDFAVAEQQVLAECEAELAQLGYDPEASEALQREVAALAPVEEEMRLLTEAEERWQEEAQALAHAQEAVEGCQRTIAELEARCAELEAALRGEASLRGALEAARQREQELRQEEEQSVKLLGATLQKLDNVANVERRLEREREELRRLEREQGIYEELARAFGKGGVQALLIERAVPEIEAEANRLLARMSDGRLAVKLETQRQTQQGQVRETLEIKVADELGTRSYETYSGGEAFRVNLALRIALSRLLARRAGAPLPTLIIDEGFGTQDASGREKLVEVLRVIQEDFERILVITHLDELKEAFPVRIEVVKTALGSTFQMVM
jgi:exonuclease SbcC